MGKLVLSLALALMINALVAVGAAVAALDVAPVRSGPTNLIVSSSALKAADVIAIRNDLNGQASLSPIVLRPEPASLGGVVRTVTVEGVQPNFALVTASQVVQGRFFTSQDETALDAVAVVSQDLAPTLSVGEVIRLRDVPFTIIGVARPVGSQNVVLVPLRTGQIRLFGATALDGMFLQVGAESEAVRVTGQVEGLLRTRHNLRPGQADDFSITNLPPQSATRTAVNGSSVLRVLEQFVCSAKNTCARLAVS